MDKITYKSLKKGWIPLPNLAKKHDLNVYKRNILITQLKEEFKEQIGKTWVVLEEEALRYL